MILSQKQHMIHSLLMFDPVKYKTFPDIPTPQWVIELGFDIKKLIDAKQISTLYFDHDGYIQCKFI